MNIKRYYLLFAGQTLGICVVLYLGLPFYRQLLINPTDYPGSGVSVPLAALAIVTIQVCHWCNRRAAARIHGMDLPFMRHLLLFFARLNFGFTGSMFALDFYQRIHEVRFFPLGIAGILAVLFSVYCYSVELESLADAFKPPPDSKSKSAEKIST